MEIGEERYLSVKTVYSGLSKSETGIYHKRIWKGRIPAKIKIFHWLISNEAILTKENLKKGNGRAILNVFSVIIWKLLTKENLKKKEMAG